MKCEVCGAELNDNAVVCPHCGVATKNYSRWQYATHNNKLNSEKNSSIQAGFILSIIGLVTSPLFIIPIISLILCLSGSKDKRKNRNKSDLATAGIIMSIVSLVIDVLAILALIFLFYLLFTPQNGQPLPM